MTQGFLIQCKVCKSKFWTFFKYPKTCKACAALEFKTEYMGKWYTPPQPDFEILPPSTSQVDYALLETRMWAAIYNGVLVQKPVSVDGEPEWCV